MTPIHIVGHAGCGKTTLIVDLVKAIVVEDPIENPDLEVFQRSEADSIADFILTLT